jgi:hypothetical protein
MMSRSITSLIALLAAVAASAPALAADYSNWDSEPSGDGGGLRTAYPTQPEDWSGLGDKDDGLRFEFGARYYYSMGASSFAINSGLIGDHGTMEETDTSQMVEAHLRIDDQPTHVYAKGVAGLAFKTDGASTDVFGTTTVNDGHLGYAGADVGYSILGDGKVFALSPFVGYMYWNNSPNTYHDNYTTAKSAADITFDPSSGQTFIPGSSSVNDINAHMLRLGISTKADMGLFDISGEVAAVPYAKMMGTLGAGGGSATGDFVIYDNQSSPSFGPTGLTGAFNIHHIQSSPTTIDGWGYGGMAEAMIGFHPSPNWVFRLGGRAWYVQGTVDASFSRATIGDPTDANQPVAGTPADPGPPPVPAIPGQINSPNFDTPPTFGNQNYITRGNPFSMLRYGVLAEVTYSF